MFKGLDHRTYNLSMQIINLSKYFIFILMKSLKDHRKFLISMA